MKTLYYTTLLTLLSIASLSAQSLYQDALSLAEILNKEKRVNNGKLLDELPRLSIIKERRGINCTYNQYIPLSDIVSSADTLSTLEIRKNRKVIDKLGYYTLKGYDKTDTLLLQFAKGKSLRLYAANDNEMMVIRSMDEKIDSAKAKYDTLLTIHNTYENLRVLDSNRNLLCESSKLALLEEDYKSRVFQREIVLLPENWDEPPYPSMTMTKDSLQQSIRFRNGKVELIEGFDYILKGDAWKNYMIYLTQGEEYLTQRENPLSYDFVLIARNETSEKRIDVNEVKNSYGEYAYFNYIPFDNYAGKQDTTSLIILHGFYQYPAKDWQEILTPFEKITKSELMAFLQDTVHFEKASALNCSIFYFDKDYKYKKLEVNYDYDSNRYDYDNGYDNTSFKMYRPQDANKVEENYEVHYIDTTSLVSKTESEKYIAFLLEDAAGNYYRVISHSEGQDTVKRFLDIYDNKQIYYDLAFVQKHNSYRTRNLRDIASILATHHHFKQSKLNTENILEETWMAYKDNELLSFPLNSYLEDQKKKALDIDFSKQLVNQVNSDYEQFYAWKEVLYNKRKFEVKKTVSYEQVLADYRKQSVTASQNLQRASQTLASRQKRSSAGINATTIAAGLSDFIVDRAQEELNITFMDRMEKAITDDFIEFKVLFPDTYKILKEFDIKQYKTLLAYSKSSFLTDLDNLGLNFPKLFDLAKYKQLADNPTVYNIALVYDLANKVYEDTPIDSVLLYLYTRLDDRIVNLNKRGLSNLSGKLLQQELAIERAQLLDANHRIFKQINDFDALMTLGVKGIKSKNGDDGKLSELWKGLSGKIQTQYQDNLDSFYTQHDLSYPYADAFKRNTIQETSTLSNSIAVFKKLKPTGFKKVIPILDAAEYKRLDQKWLYNKLEAKNDPISQYKEYELLIPKSLNAEIDYDFELSRLPYGKFDEYFGAVPSDSVLLGKGLTLLKKFINSDQILIREKWLEEMQEVIDTSLTHFRMLRDINRSLDYSDNAVAYFHLKQRKDTVIYLLDRRISDLKAKAEAAQLVEIIRQQLLESYERFERKINTRKTGKKTEWLKEIEEQHIKDSLILQGEFQEITNSLEIGNKTKEEFALLIKNIDQLKEQLGQEMNDRYDDLERIINEDRPLELRVKEEQLIIEEKLDKRIAKFESKIESAEQKITSNRKKGANKSTKNATQKQKLFETLAKRKKIESDKLLGQYNKLLNRTYKQLIDEMEDDPSKFVDGFSYIESIAVQGDELIARQEARFDTLEYTVNRRFTQTTRERLLIYELAEERRKTLKIKNRKINQLESKLKVWKDQKKASAVQVEKIKTYQREINVFLRKRLNRIRAKIEKQNKKTAQRPLLQLVEQEQKDIQSILDSSFDLLLFKTEQKKEKGAESKQLIHAAESLRYLKLQFERVKIDTSFLKYDRDYKLTEKAGRNISSKAKKRNQGENEQLKTSRLNFEKYLNRSIKALKDIDDQFRIDLSNNMVAYHIAPTQQEVDTFINQSVKDNIKIHPNFYSKKSKLPSKWYAFRDSLYADEKRQEALQLKKASINNYNIEGYSKSSNITEERTDEPQISIADVPKLHDIELLQYLLGEETIIIRERDDYDAEVKYFEQMSQLTQEMRMWLDTIAQDEKKMEFRLKRLEKQYTNRAYQAQTHAQILSTITEVSLHMLDAFRHGSLEEQIITMPDSTRQIIKEQKDGKEITYDNLLINKIEIAKGVGVDRWISREQFRQVMEDTLSRAAYLGLLYQRLANATDSEYVTPEGIAQVSTQLIYTIYDIDDLKATLKYKKNLGKRITFQDYYPFIRSTVDFLNTIINAPIGEQPLSAKYEELKDFASISDQSLALFENIFAKDYGKSIQNLVNMFSYIWAIDVLDAQEDQRLIQDLRNQIALGGSNESYEKQLRKLERKTDRLKKALLTYGSFMAEIVAAEDANAVKAALKAAAVPPGSSSVKRTSKWNLALNAYFGGGYYRETLNTDALPKEEQTSGSIGLSVPVGLTLTRGSIGLKNWSYSLFMPILDLGVVTAFRIDEQNENRSGDLPELSFSNLIAPGAYFIVNVPKSPFSISAGAQFGPQVRTITVNGADIQSSAWRYGVTATIDVPIFNLFNR